MIFLPVKPESAAGPPRTNEPDGLITSLVLVKSSLGQTFLMIYSVRTFAISSLVTLGSCWVEIKIL